MGPKYKDSDAAGPQSIPEEDSYLIQAMTRIMVSKKRLFGLIPGSFSKKSWPTDFPRIWLYMSNLGQILKLRSNFNNSGQILKFRSNFNNLGQILNTK